MLKKKKNTWTEYFMISAVVTVCCLFLISIYMDPFLSWHVIIVAVIQYKYPKHLHCEAFLWFVPSERHTWCCTAAFKVIALCHILIFLLRMRNIVVLEHTFISYHSCLSMNFILSHTLPHNHAQINSIEWQQFVLKSLTTE